MRQEVLIGILGGKISSTTLFFMRKKLVRMLKLKIADI